MGFYTLSPGIPQEPDRFFMGQPRLKIIVYFLANLGYNISKKELHDVGIVTMNTTFGNPVPVYDADTEVTEQQIGI